jgi:predicted alpha/beta-hydrolase family hydrolase
VIYSNVIFVFAHGAGAGMDSDFIVEVSQQLIRYGIEVKRFEFPYMKIMRAEGKRRPPDRMPKLLTAFEEELNQLSQLNSNQDKKFIVGGKSMGGRVASLLAASHGRALNIEGVVCFGFPFHPPKKPDNYRGEHLETLNIPTLILQGERDPFGTKKEISQYKLSRSINVKLIKDGDHSFKPRVKSGTTLDKNIECAVNHIITFVDKVICNKS